MDKPRDLRGCAGTSWKIACAVGRDLTLGQLAELLVRDRLLQAEVRAAMERAPTLPWDSRVPRIGEAPKRAPGTAREPARPAALPGQERAPERAAEALPGMPAVAGSADARGEVERSAGAVAATAAAAVAAAAAAPARRGAFGRRAAAADDGGMGQLQALIADRLGGAR